VECATAHGNIHDHSLSTNHPCRERNRKIRRQTFILTAIFLDSPVRDAPLETLETVSAKLAFKGIHIEQADQALAEADSANTFDVFSRTSGAQRSWHRVSFLFVTCGSSMEHQRVAVKPPITFHYALAGSINNFPFMLSL
jgi:hypothetical protein